ncbi:glyco protein hormone beta-5 [Trichinella spiralis]|nr:glyco protein hormone beta-5 [Trichinella spiralis]
MQQPCYEKVGSVGDACIDLTEEE